MFIAPFHQTANVLFQFANAKLKVKRFHDLHISSSSSLLYFAVSDALLSVKSIIFALLVLNPTVLTLYSSIGESSMILQMVTLEVSLSK